MRIDTRISNSRLHCTSGDITKTVSVFLWNWACGISFSVVTVSTGQFQTVQFVQYLYSTCAVLLCSWTYISSFCVITVSAVQLETLLFVQYLYSKCSVVLCSCTCWSRFCVIIVSTFLVRSVQCAQYFYSKCAVLCCILIIANVYKLYRVSLNIRSLLKWGIPRLSGQ